LTDRKKFRVLENNDIVLETDSMGEAVFMQRVFHNTRPGAYHEIYALIDGEYVGIRQYKPGDKIKQQRR